MQLRDWIRELGTKDAAARFDTDDRKMPERTTRAWMNGQRFPTSSQAGRIPEITGGLVRLLTDVYPATDERR